MGISIRGMAIGALSRVKEKQDASAEEERQKRLENRKFKMQQKLQTQQDVAHMERTKYASDARTREAASTLSTTNAKNKRIAFTKEQETYDQFGLGGPKGILGENLPIQFRALRSKTQDASYRGIFDGAVGYVIKKYNAITDPDLQKSKFNLFNNWLADRVPRLLVETDAFKPSKDSAGQFDLDSRIHLESALKQTFAHMSTVPDLKKILEAQKVDFESRYEAPEQLMQYVNNYPNSFTAQRLTGKFGPHEQTILHGQFSKWGELGTTGLVKSLSENNEAGMIAAAEMMSTMNSLMKHDLKPQPSLDATVAAASVALGQGKTIQIVKGMGRQQRIRYNPKRREDEIKAATERHNTNDTLLHQITQARQLNLTLQVGSYDSKKATFTLNIFRHFEKTLNSLRKGLNFDITSKDNSIEFSDNDKKDMVGAFTRAGIENGEEFLQKMQDASNDKLTGAKEALIQAFKGGNIQEEKIAQERFYNEVRYEALKIQLVYRVAKMVQGGSGGQAVSNADFQAVLKSFQAGKWGNLQNEQAVFQQLQYMTEREYIHSKVMTSRAVLENEDNVATRALQFHRIQYEVMRQRKLREKQQDDQAGAAAGPLSADERLKAEAARIANDMLKKKNQRQSDVAAPG
jgi:hypothetical protein